MTDANAAAATAANTLQSRHATLDLLAAVIDEGQPLSAALEGQKGLAGLAERDRAFARHLATTTLRRLGQIDATIAACVERPPRGRARGVLPLLRLGVCQILFLRTPAHAAVDTTVRLARERGLDAYIALVNAVLRRVDREGPVLLAAQDAARLNTPDWLWDSWCRAYVEAVLHAVRPGGHVIVATFAKDGPAQCSGLPVMRYDADGLHAEFGAPFMLVKHDEEAHHTPFGTVQQFIYCYCRRAST